MLGAGDGETGDLTLGLEERQGWTGEPGNMSKSIFYDIFRLLFIDPVNVYMLHPLLLINSLFIIQSKNSEVEIISLTFLNHGKANQV